MFRVFYALNTLPTEFPELADALNAARELLRDFPMLPEVRVIELPSPPNSARPHYAYTVTRRA